jgi:hypothetical protein
MIIVTRTVPETEPPENITFHLRQAQFHSVYLMINAMVSGDATVTDTLFSRSISVFSCFGKNAECARLGAYRLFILHCMAAWMPLSTML